MVKTADKIDTIIATSCDDEKKVAEYEKRGCKILILPKEKTGIDLKSLMLELGKMGIDSVLIEGGGTLNYSALESKIVDEIHIHMAPKIFGGSSKSPVEGPWGTFDRARRALASARARLCACRIWRARVQADGARLRLLRSGEYACPVLYGHRKWSRAHGCYLSATADRAPSALRADYGRGGGILGVPCLRCG